MKKYKLRFKTAAKRQLNGLPQQVRNRLTRKIYQLRDNPRPSGVKKLKGEYFSQYRIRDGDYRAIYQIEDDILLVLVVKVGHRKGVY